MLVTKAFAIIRCDQPAVYGTSLFVQCQLMKIAYIALPWLSRFWNNCLVSGIIVLFWDKRHTTVLPVASVEAASVCERPGDFSVPNEASGVDGVLPRATALRPVAHPLPTAPLLPAYA